MISGCMSSTPKAGPPQRVVVVPCHVMDMPEIRLVGGLDSKNVAGVLLDYFVDDLKTKGGLANRDTFTLNCYWGNNVGEVRNYYYCVGKYKAPQTDDTGKIERFLWKEFKIGFDVDNRIVVDDSDRSGLKPSVPDVRYLKTKSVDAECYVV